MSLVRLARIIVGRPGGRWLWWGIIAPLLRRGRIESITEVSGIKMYLNIGIELDFLYALTDYDTAEIDFLVNNWDSDSSILDVGANQGYYSLLLAHKIPRARVLSFEPDPRNIERLMKNISLNNLNNITICPYALVGDNSESKPMFMKAYGNWGDNSMVESPWQKHEIVKDVPCKTLFQAIKENGITKIGCIKVDIEGFEYPVLKRFFNDVPNESPLRPKAFVVESVGHMISKIGGSSIELLCANGYRLVNHTQYNFFFLKCGMCQ